jgi:hypothetical protein
MNSAFGKLRTLGAILTIGEEHFILRKATQKELMAHGIIDDPNQATMGIQNGAVIVNQMEDSHDN